MMGDEKEYGGDVTCVDAHRAATNNRMSTIIDVRTKHEWQTIGIPFLENGQNSIGFIEWQKFPEMQFNDTFVADVEKFISAKGASKSDPIYLLCRTGGRSKNAAIALTQAGFTQAKNILSGFEGVPDENGERGTIEGWQFNKLPWKKE